MENNTLNSLLHGLKLSQQLSEVNSITQLIYNKTELDSLFDLAPIVIYIKDHLSNKLLYINYEIKNLVGIDASDILDKNLQTFSTLIHPDDKEKLEGELNIQFINQIQQVPENHFKYLQISKNYRIQHKSGKYIQCMDQSVILDANFEMGNLITLGVITNIDVLKQDNEITISIKEFDNQNNLINTYLLKNQVQISNREQEIMELISNGDSSKNIAEKLKISIHTVNIHRKNLLKKYDSSNASELILKYSKSKLK